MTLRFWQIGNLRVPHSTESDLLDTLERMGHTVETVQEERADLWDVMIARLAAGDKPDAIIWTRTKSLSDQVDTDDRWRLLIQAHLADVPTIGIHLDRWWGLSRQNDLYQDPFFRVQYLFTADGHDPKRWAALGANHHWMPPAIAPRWCFDGTPQARYECEIAFVGGWHDYGHTEWTHRRQLVEWLGKNYRGRVRFFPERGQPAIRGADLNDLYASVKVVVGDSCLVPDPITGEPWTHYCSDRLFEVIGRGALLIHPSVEGVTRGKHRLLTNSVDLLTWKLGNWDELHETIVYALCSDEGAREVRKGGTEWVRDRHTYKQRLEDIFATVGLAS